MAAFCLEVKKGQFKAALEILDQLNGFNFNANFSFALAGHLLKGMKNANTKAATAKLLSTIISYSREPNLSNLLGYLCALLPNISDENAYLRQLFFFFYFFILFTFLIYIFFYLRFLFTFFYFYLHFLFYIYFFLIYIFFFISSNYFNFIYLLNSFFFIDLNIK